MSFEKSYYQVGSLRIRKASLRRWMYRSVAILVAVMFVSSLVYMILFGQSPQ